MHVVYGVLGLKTHAKMCLVVRREEQGIQRYVHMSTNYNTITGRIYTDLSYFTCDPVIGADILTCSTPSLAIPISTPIANCWWRPTACGAKSSGALSGKSPDIASMATAIWPSR